jgi:hypothetical protein
MWTLVKQLDADLRRIGRPADGGKRMPAGGLGRTALERCSAMLKLVKRHSCRLVGGPATPRHFVDPGHRHVIARQGRLGGRQSVRDLAVLQPPPEATE